MFNHVDWNFGSQQKLKIDSSIKSRSFETQNSSKPRARVFEPDSQSGIEKLFGPNDFKMFPLVIFSAWSFSIVIYF